MDLDIVSCKFPQKHILEIFGVGDASILNQYQFSP